MQTSKCIPPVFCLYTCIINCNKYLLHDIQLMVNQSVFTVRIKTWRLYFYVVGNVSRTVDSVNHSYLASLYNAVFPSSSPYRSCYLFISTYYCWDPVYFQPWGAFLQIDLLGNFVIMTRVMCMSVSVGERRQQSMRGMDGQCCSAFKRDDICSGCKCDKQRSGSY